MEKKMENEMETRLILPLHRNIYQHSGPRFLVKCAV